VIGGTTYKFEGDKEILEIRTANKDSDSLTGDFWEESVHFDNEGLALCSNRIKDLKAKAIEALTGSGNPDGALARRFTGQALHTLQDFYAHSNWVDLIGFGFRNNDINNDLGRNVMTNPSKEVQFCPDDPFTVAKVNGVTTGYFMLPSLQGLLLISIPGIFILNAYRETCQQYPTGKCRHGIDEISLICDGINKDTPSRTGHSLAGSLAEQGSKDFIEQILNDPGVKESVDAVEAYLGPQGALAFAIDNTVSAIACLLVVLVCFSRMTSSDRVPWEMISLRSSVQWSCLSQQQTLLGLFWWRLETPTYLQPTSPQARMPFWIG
jgi:von Willebrand factor A domain-containing protein 7